MKSFIKILGVMALAFAMTGCDPYKGILEVKKAFTVTSVQTNPNCGNAEAGYVNCEQKVTVSVPAGSHQAQMKMINRYQLQVSAKIGNKNKTITFDLPKNHGIPTSGSFIVPASKIGQDFSLEGNIDTQVTESGKKSGYEACSYSTWEHICYVVENQLVCRDQWVTRHGQQYVEYFNRTTNKNLKLNFVDTETFATFTGNRASVERVYLAKGRCY